MPSTRQSVGCWLVFDLTDLLNNYTQASIIPPDLQSRQEDFREFRLLASNLSARKW